MQNEPASEQSSDAILSLSSLLLDKTLDMLSLTQFMEPYLTSRDDAVRIRALELYRDIFHSNWNLNTGQIEKFISFFVAKLDNIASLGVTLECLIALLKNEGIPESSWTEIAEALTENIQIQLYYPSVRLDYYRLLHHCIVANPPALDEGDFLANYLIAIDGEKDPECLAVIFDSTLICMKNYDISYLAEEFFTSFYTYFPITFVATQNKDLTPEILKKKLSECICGSQMMACYALPELVDKLSSLSVVARIDTFNVLADTTKMYRLSDINQYVEGFIAAIVKELAGTDENCKVAALNCLLYFGRFFSISTSADNENFQNFFNIALSHILPMLEKDEESVVYSAIKFLKTLAASSMKYLSLITSKLMSQIISLSVKDTPGLSFAVIDFIGAISKLEQIHRGDDSQMNESVLLMYKDRIFEFIIKQLTITKDNDSKLLSLSLLFDTVKQFLTLSNFFAEIEVRQLSTAMISWSSNKQNDSSAQLEAFDVLSMISKAYPHIAYEEMIPSLCDQGSEGLGKIIFDEKTFKCAFQELRASNQDLNLLRPALHAPLSQKYMLEILNSLITTTVLKSGSTLLIQRFISYLFTRLNQQNQQAIYTMYQQTNTELQMLLLPGLRPEISFDVLSTVNTILHLINDDMKALWLNVYRSLASVLNKADEETLREISSSLQFNQTINEFLSMPKNHDEHQDIFLTLLLRGLIMAGQPLGYDLCQKYIASSTFDCTKILANVITDQEDYDCLTENYHAIIKKYYAQRYFTYILEKAQENPVLIPVVLLMSPKIYQGVLDDYLSILIPMFLLGLTSNDAASVTASLAAVRKNLKKVSAYDLKGLLSSLLALSTSPLSIDIRVKGLELLTHLADIVEDQEIIAKIVKMLQPSLNDHKRVVRSAATACRSKWFLKVATS